MYEAGPADEAAAVSGLLYDAAADQIVVDPERLLSYSAAPLAHLLVHEATHVVYDARSREASAMTVREMDALLRSCREVSVRFRIAAEVVAYVNQAAWISAQPDPSALIATAPPSEQLAAAVRAASGGEFEKRAFVALVRENAESIDPPAPGTPPCSPAPVVLRGPRRGAPLDAWSAVPEFSATRSILDSLGRGGAKLKHEGRRARGLCLPWPVLRIVAATLLAAGCASAEKDGGSENAATVGDPRDASIDRSSPSGSGGATSSGDGASTSGAAGAPGDGSALPYPVGKCPEGLPGPTLVNVPALAGRTYCIDATEVTRGQYQEFVEARYAKQFMPVAPACDGGFAEGTQVACEDVELPSCDGNVYEPTERLVVPENTLCEGGACPEPGTDLGCTWWLTGMDDYPINCIDWCDAAGYCEWAGKRLCGAIGSVSEFITACEGWWHEAPWSPGAYSASGRDDLAACNFDHGDAYEGLAPVGALKTCEGGFPGLFDLKGNVYEFASSPLDCCGALGGAFTSVHVNLPFRDTYTECRSMLPVGPTTVQHNIGFRCCADALPVDP